MSRFVLEICGLTKAYSGNALAVGDLDIAVSRQARSSGLVLGPNSASRNRRSAW
ncbi:MAG: hypothetical protein H6836_01345 [Planctomycetes bacterium]|nr:hypothetical protein [Planctomycetota bacterium]